MSHPDEGTLVMFRDNALIEASVQAHIDDCSVCQVAVSDARARGMAIESLLSELDRTHDLEEAKSAVRARLDRASPQTPSGFVSIWGSRLGRAAAVLLLAAGAVSALPGSPVRNWIEDSMRAPDPAGSTTQGLSIGERSGVAVPTNENGIRIVLAGATPGSEIEVLWVDGSTSRISAPEGSGFSYGDGLLEAQLADGAVRIEIPRSGPVSVEVDGMVYLRGIGDVVEVEGPWSDRSEDRILFTIPQP